MMRLTRLSRFGRWRRADAPRHSSAGGGDLLVGVGLLALLLLLAQLVALATDAFVRLIGG
jgi:hypothetical protein